MKAAVAIIQCLQKEDIKIVFGYPGVPVGPLITSGMLALGIKIFHK